jgi:hypothetical protein
MQMKSLRLALLASILAGSAPTAFGQSEIVNALPEGAAIVVTVRNVDEFIRKAKDTPIYKLTERQDLAAMVAEIAKGWTEICDQARKETGIELESFLRACKGEISFAVGDLGTLAQKVATAAQTLEEPDIRPEEIPIIAYLDTRDGKAEFAKNLDILLAKAKSEGVRTEKDAFRSGSITTLHRPEGDEDGPQAVFVGELGTRYILALDKNLLQRTMVSLDSGEKANTLGQTPTYQLSQRETAGQSSDFSFYVNLRSIVDAVDTILRDHMAAFFWQKARTLLIGKALNGLSLTLTVDANGLRQNVFVHNDGNSDGVLGWFKGTTVAAPPPALIPDEALSCSSMVLNMREVFKVIREIASTALAFSGQGNPEALFEQTFGMKLADLERSFGMRMHSFQTTGATEDNPVGDLCMIFELEDDAPMKSLLEKVSVISEGQFTAEKYLNRDLYVAPTGGPIAPCITVTDRLFVFGLGREGVERVVRRIGKTEGGIGGTDEFRKTAGFFPSPIVGLSYTHQKLFEQSLDTIFSSFTSAADAPEWLGTFLQALVRSFGTSVAYMQWHDAGLYSTSWSPFRKQ